jgi:hypothetical protein
MMELGGDDVGELNIPRLRVSLRIRGDALDPDFLTQQLGVAPSFSARKGDVTIRRGRERLHTTGVWSYRAEVPSGTELGDALLHLLAALPQNATGRDHELVRRGPVLRRVPRGRQSEHGRPAGGAE